MWGMSGMWIFWILVIIAVVGFIWWMVGNTHSVSASREALYEILTRRYASGEIDKAEYERRLAGLRR